MDKPAQHARLVRVPRRLQHRGRRDLSDKLAGLVVARPSAELDQMGLWRAVGPTGRTDKKIDHAVIPLWLRLRPGNLRGDPENIVRRTRPKRVCHTGHGQQFLAHRPPRHTLGRAARQVRKRLFNLTQARYLHFD